SGPARRSLVNAFSTRRRDAGGQHVGKEVMLSMSTRAAALLAAALLLAACGAGGGGAAGSGTHPSGSGAPASPLLPDDFKGVCSGATESRAADYAGSRRHKALYFETYEDELLDESSRLPSDWTAQF